MDPEEAGKEKTLLIVLCAVRLQMSFVDIVKSAFTYRFVEEMTLLLGPLE